MKQEKVHHCSAPAMMKAEDNSDCCTEKNLSLLLILVTCFAKRKLNIYRDIDCFRSASDRRGWNIFIVRVRVFRFGS